MRRRPSSNEQRIEEAFAATPRADYLPESVRDHWREDRPLLLAPVSREATNSQPSTVRDMLRLLEVPPGARVLDVGSGSGWTTALLAHLVGDSGKVIGVEIDPALVTFGAANLAATQRDWARIETADPGRLGYPAEAPYDRILVSAMAATMPEELIEQLAPEGIMVVPVNGRMQRVRREGGRVRVERHGSYRFVPLR